MTQSDRAAERVDPAPDSDGPTVPDDFDAEDSMDGGCECCAWCKRSFSMNGGYVGEVFDQNGREYDHVLDTEPGESALFCPPCWDVLDANQKSTENRSLTDFGGAA